MKKVFLASLATALALTVFTACPGNNKEDDDQGYKVTAAGVTGADAVRKVTAVYNTGSATADAITSDVITTVDFTNRGFSLELPRIVPSDKLELSSNTLMEFPAGVTMTPGSFNGTTVSFLAYDAGNEYIGDFEMLDNAEEPGVAATYIYSDRAVSITGTGTGTEEDEVDGEPVETDVEWVYEVSLVPGWNIVYEKMEFTEGTGETADKVKYTTTTGTQTVKWVYISDEAE